MTSLSSEILIILAKIKESDNNFIVANVSNLLNKIDINFINSLEENKIQELINFFNKNILNTSILCKEIFYNILVSSIEKYYNIYINNTTHNVTKNLQEENDDLKNNIKKIMEQNDGLNNEIKFLKQKLCDENDEYDEYDVYNECKNIQKLTNNIDLLLKYNIKLQDKNKILNKKIIASDITNQYLQNKNDILNKQIDIMNNKIVDLAQENDRLIEEYSEEHRISISKQKYDYDMNINDLTDLTDFIESSENQLNEILKSSIQNENNLEINFDDFDDLNFDSSLKEIIFSSPLKTPERTSITQELSPERTSSSNNNINKSSVSIYTRKTKKIVIEQKINVSDILSISISEKIPKKIMKFFENILNNIKLKQKKKRICSLITKYIENIIVIFNKYVIHITDYNLCIHNIDLLIRNIREYFIFFDRDILINYLKTIYHDEIFT
jgi:hypothetical protein